MIHNDTVLKAIFCVDYVFMQNAFIKNLILNNEQFSMRITCISQSFLNERKASMGTV